MDDLYQFRILSYHHHQIGSLNYYPLFRVMSWNNGMCCMSLYILINVLPLLSLACIYECVYKARVYVESLSYSLYVMHICVIIIFLIVPFNPLCPCVEYISFYNSNFAIHRWMCQVANCKRWIQRFCFYFKIKLMALKKILNCQSGQLPG